MPDRTTSSNPQNTGLQTSSVPASSWTGRVPFDLKHWSSHLVAKIELVVHLDTISVWCGQHLADMPRTVFAQWLHGPEDTLTIDQIRWTVRGPHICLSLNSGPTYPVPRPTIDQLRQVL